MATNPRGPYARKASAGPQTPVDLRSPAASIPVLMRGFDVDLSLREVSEMDAAQRTVVGHALVLQAFRQWVEE